MSFCHSSQEPMRPDDNWLLVSAVTVNTIISHWMVLDLLETIKSLNIFNPHCAYYVLIGLTNIVLPPGIISQWLLLSSFLFLLFKLNDQSLLSFLWAHFPGNYHKWLISLYILKIWTSIIIFENNFPNRPYNLNALARLHKTVFLRSQLGNQYTKW